jgi:hypothetical protein
MLSFLHALRPPARRAISSLKLWIDPGPHCDISVPTQLPSTRGATIPKPGRHYYENTMLRPWRATCAFLVGELPALHKVCIRTPLQRSAVAHFDPWCGLGSVSAEWLRFFQRGWMEELARIPGLQILRVEALVHSYVSPPGLSEKDVDAINALRAELWEMIGFAGPAEWFGYLFESNSYMRQVFPSTGVRLDLRRIEALPPGGMEPLPDFVQKYTRDDFYSSMICCFGGHSYRPPTPHDR